MAHVWRGVLREYADRLGVTESSTVVTLGEGGTPLIPAAALAKLVYAPAPDYHGPDGFGFKVWDDSGADGGPGLASA